MSYALVVADPLYKLHAGDSNAEREAVDLMRRFDAWREQLRLRAATARPLPQAGARRPASRSTTCSAPPRTCAAPKSCSACSASATATPDLHFLKDRDGDLPIGDRLGAAVRPRAGLSPATPTTANASPTAAEQVRELLEQTPGMTKEQFAEATGKKSRTVEGALRELERHG